MANIRVIRRRIRSVQNTAKVTRAMEMIAASKMRRSQQRLLAGRPYSEMMLEVLGHLAAQMGDAGDDVHPLLRRREVKRVEVIHITPDRGLCGGLNSNLNRVAGRFMLDRDVPVSVIPVGRKGRDFMVRTGREVRAVFVDMGDRPSLMDTLPISHLVIDDYESGYADEVYVGYSRFFSTVVQRPVMQKLLPIEPAHLESNLRGGYIYEPSSIQVLGSLLPRFVEMQIYHAMLESIGSEQSARMVAMRNATDSANDMIQSLTLLMNKVRQESITKELLDIVGGAVALEG
ncbi:MAG: ATP synthase F1 subunit gamma [Chloroflexi bacterium]|nr:ATP synthase F1 subunit gamma [Chloroflexota bacterium]